jgi:hypothetical protein
MGAIRRIDLIRAIRQRLTAALAPPNLAPIITRGLPKVIRATTEHLAARIAGDTLVRAADLDRTPCGR